MPEKQLENKESEIRECLYCGLGFTESNSTADDRESYCCKDHEQYDLQLQEIEREEDASNEDEEDEDELEGL